jgi:hypothetical protein
MNRRLFLSRLGVGTVSAAAAVCAFDVERLLWVPRERSMFLLTPRSIDLPFGMLNADSVEGAEWRSAFGRIRQVAIRLRAEQAPA